MPAFRNVRSSRSSPSPYCNHYQYRQGSDAELPPNFVAKSPLPLRPTHDPSSRTWDPAKNSAPTSEGPWSLPHDPKKDSNSHQILPIGLRSKLRSVSSPTPSPPHTDFSKTVRSVDTIDGQICPLAIKIPQWRRRDKDRIPGQKGPFSLFRSEFYQRFSEAAYEEILESLNHANMVQQAEQRWNSLSVEEKKPYIARAAAENKAHATMYPDYVYTPNEKVKLFGTPSRAFKRKTSNDRNCGMKLSPRRHSLKPHPGPRLSFARPIPAPNPPQTSHSWGSRCGSEQSSKMNPITDISYRMNISDKASESLDLAMAGGTGVPSEQETRGAWANNPLRYTLSVDTRSGDTQRMLAPPPLDVARTIGPFTTPNRVSDIKVLRSSQGGDLCFGLVSGDIADQSIRISDAVTRGDTSDELGSIRYPEFRRLGQLKMPKPKSARTKQLQLNLNEHQNTSISFTKTSSSGMGRMGAQWNSRRRGNVPSSEFERGFGISGIRMPEQHSTPLPIMPNQGYTAPHSLPVSKKPSPISTIMTIREHEHSSPVLGPPAASFILSTPDNGHRFTRSHFRVARQPSPTISAVSSRRSKRNSTTPQQVPDFGSSSVNINFLSDVGLGSVSVLTPLAFPPLQFAAGTVPEAFSLQILGLNFMAY